MNINSIFTVLLLISVATAQSVLAMETKKETLTLALDADLSAVAIEGGEAIRAGIEIAIEEINEQGGVLGKQLVLETFDHRGNPARGIRNIEKIAARKDVLAVFSGVHTPVALAELEHIHKHNLLFMVPWAAGTSIVDNKHSPNNVFRVSIRDQEAGAVLVRHASQRGVKRVALVLERTDWGRSNLSSLTKAAGEHGLNIVNTQWINWRQSAFEAEMSAITESGAEAIILVTNAPEAAVVAKTMIANNASTMPVISHWGLTGGDFVRAFDDNQLATMDISVIQTFSFLKQSNPRSSYLLQQYLQRHPHSDAASIPAAVGVAHSYDLVHLLASATKIAGSTSTDEIRHTLENLPPLTGAVKHYAPAFTVDRHDALMADSYFMTTFNTDGNLVPISTTQ